MSDALARKPPHTFRILLLGNSYAYGLGVASHQNLSTSLQEVLNKRYGSPCFEVLNVARPGMNLVEEWAVLRHLNAYVEYDLLLLCLSSDDAQSWSRQELAGFDAHWEETWPLQWHNTSGCLDHVRDVLGSIVRVQTAINRKLAITFYEPVTSSSETPLATLSEICLKLSVPFLDLVSLFSKLDQKLLCVSPADDHPSPLAHRMAAKELVDFLDPLLPPREPVTERQLQDKFDDRLVFFEASGKQHPPGSAVAYRQLASTATPRGTPEFLTVERLRRLLNQHYHLVWYLSPLRPARISLSVLNWDLYSLERHLLLSELGVAGIRNRAPLQAEMLDLLQKSTELLRRLDTVPDVLPDLRTQESTGDQATSIIHELCEGVISRLQADLFAFRVSAEELRAACQRAQEIVRSRNQIPDAGDEARKLTDEIIKGLKNEITALERLQGGPQYDYRTELVLEVQVPTFSDALNISLIGNYIVLYPHSQRHRQVHYVIADGHSHAYRLEIPEGTVGFAHISLKFSYNVDRAIVEENDHYIKGVLLKRGPFSEQYTLGDMIYSPLPLNGSQTW